MGSKMRRVKSALEDKISMPKVDVLEKGKQIQKPGLTVFSFASLSFG